MKTTIKKKINFKLQVGVLLSICQFIGFIGITLVFPQTHFGNNEIVKNNVLGIYDYINKNENNISELRDVGYLNDEIEFNYSKDSIELLYSSPERKIPVPENNDYIVPKIDETIIGNIDIKNNTVNYNAKNMWDIFNKDVMSSDKYWETFFQYVKDDETNNWEWKSKGEFQYFKLLESGSKPDLKYNIMMGEKNVNEDVALLFMIDELESIRKDQDFSYQYFPWGSNVFMNHYFQNNNNASLMMGISFLLMIGALIMTIIWNTQLYSNKKISKKLMIWIPLLLIPGSIISTSFITLGFGLFATILSLGLSIEFLKTFSKEYQNDKLEILKDKLSSYEQKLKYSDDITEKEIYQLRIKKAKDKLKKI